MSNNFDLLIEKMVGWEELPKYKEQKLPEQFCGDLLAHIGQLEKQIASMNYHIKGCRRQLAKAAGEHLRAQLGEDDSKSNKCRLHCDELSRVYNRLGSAEQTDGE